jgi:hypothetical protein
VDLYIHSPIRLHGGVLSGLSTGQLYLFFFYATSRKVADWIPDEVIFKFT